jgi:dTDP-4-dehydrorhamnose 3,5-epimerase
LHTAILNVLLLEPQVFGEARGYFYESFNERRFMDLIAATEPLHFVQDNQSRSGRHVLRGLHYRSSKRKAN